MKSNKKTFIILDWAGNIIPTKSFLSFDEAEEYLEKKLGNNYETDRQEYFIDECEN
jgi:hypothetical protein